jgi:hypothetical protein
MNTDRKQEKPTIRTLENPLSGAPQSSQKGEEYYLDAAKLISGNPKQTVWMDYTDPSAQFMVGIWRGEQGKWHVHYTEEEYCRMLEGISIVTDENGTSITLKAGDEFIVPAGFKGTWDVVETTIKRFVIYERNC